jgi:hypothetical protein
MKSYDAEPTSLLALRRKSCYGLYRSKNTLSFGLAKLANLGSYDKQVRPPAATSLD